MRHQVGAKGYLTSVLSNNAQDILQKHSIEHDIAVIGNEKIRLLLIDVFHPRPIELRGGLL